MLGATFEHPHCDGGVTKVTGAADSLVFQFDNTANYRFKNN